MLTPFAHHVIARARAINPDILSADDDEATYDNAVRVLLEEDERDSAAMFAIEQSDAPITNDAVTPIESVRETHPRTLPVFEPRIFSAPDERGIMHTIAKRTYGDLYRHVKAALAASTLANGEVATREIEYTGLTARFDGHESQQLPDYRWVACYAVTGGSEGYYVHVDLIVDTLTARGFSLDRTITIKTFASMDVACELARILTYALGA